jgi:hypothetical protein
VIHLFYSLLFLALFVYLGAGLTLLLTPPAFKRYSLLIAPLVGYCYMTLAGWYFFANGFRGTDNYAVFLCLPPVGFLCLGMYRLRGHDGFRPLLNRDVALASLLGLCALLVVALPWLTSARGLSAISLGNADIAYYAVQARYLKGFRMYERVGFFDQEPAILSEAHARFGPVLASALPSSVFSLETYQLQNIVMQGFFGCTVLMIYVVGREVFQYNPSRAAAGSALATLSPLLFYAVYHNFEGQIIGMPLAFALVVLHAQVVRLGKVSDYLRYFPLTALLTFGFSISYGHMVPLLLGAIGVQTALFAWRRRSGSDIRRWIVFSLATLLATVTASPEQARLAVGQLLFYGGGVGSVARTPQGWFVPWLFPTGLFIQPNAFPWNDIEPPIVLRMMVFISFGVLVTLGMFASYRTNRDRFGTMLSWLVVTLLGTTALAYLDRSALGWGGYASYKWLSFFLPFVLFALVAAIPDPPGARPRTIACGACLFLLLSVSAYYSSRESLHMMTVDFVGSEMAELQSIESDARVDSVNILDDPGDTLNAMWKANFLARKRLYLEQRTYYSASDLLGNWTLQSRGEPGYGGVLYVEGLDSSRLIHVNQRYVLAPARRELTVRFGGGWWPNEPANRWTGNGSSSADLLLHVAAERMPVSFAAEYWPLNPKDALTIYLDRQLLTECRDNARCATPRFELSPGEHVLELRAELPPSQPDNGDVRTLGYNFSRIQIDRPR